MAARRRRRRYSSRRGPRPFQTWFFDGASGVAAPASSIAARDVLLSDGDYAILPGAIGEKVRVKRILFEFWISPSTSGVTPSGGVTWNWDIGLVATLPDQMSANIVSALSVYQMLEGGLARVIRAKTLSFTEPDSVTAVGINPQFRHPRWTVSVKTGLVLKEPQTLYFVQKPATIDASAVAAYEYSYRSRVYYERIN